MDAWMDGLTYSELEPTTLGYVDGWDGCMDGRVAACQEMALLTYLHMRRCSFLITSPCSCPATTVGATPPSPYSKAPWEADSPHTHT